MKKQKVLIIEDEDGIRDALAFILSEKYELEQASNGLFGIKKALKFSPDAILLDLKMPEMDGFQVCKILRSDPDFNSVPIIVLSAFNDPLDKTKAFELGADDYITKPFDDAELLARINRKLQSKGSSLKEPSTSSGLNINEVIVIDKKNQQVKILDVDVPLSGIEFKLLLFLVNQYPELATRESIVDWVWEKQPVSLRLVDPHILSLRNKLNAHNFTIHSVYGKGYVLKKV